MKSGLGHQADHEISKDGSMAIFCPACPQPGVNLPDNWKTKYSLYVTHFIQHFIITYIHTGTSSSAHSLWMGIFQWSICDIGPARRMFPYPLEWHSWPILKNITIIFRAVPRAVQKCLRQVRHLFDIITSDQFIHSLTHATLTRQLSKLTPVVRT